MLKNYIVIIWFPLTVFLCFCLSSLVQTYPLANDFPQTKGRQRPHGARTIGVLLRFPSRWARDGSECASWVSRLAEEARGPCSPDWMESSSTDVLFYFWGERRGRKFWTGVSPLPDPLSPSPASPAAPRLHLSSVPLPPVWACLVFPSAGLGAETMRRRLFSRDQPPHRPPSTPVTLSCGFGVPAHSSEIFLRTPVITTSKSLLDLVSERVWWWEAGGAPSSQPLRTVGAAFGLWWGLVFGWTLEQTN